MKNDYIGLLWLFIVAINAIIGRWDVATCFTIIFYGENILHKLNKDK